MGATMTDRDGMAEKIRRVMLPTQAPDVVVERLARFVRSEVDAARTDQPTKPADAVVWDGSAVRTLPYR
jgi:hypothetical protein